MAKNEILEELKKQFPETWFKAGTEFDPDSFSYVWSGSHAVLGGKPAFDGNAWEWDTNEEEYVMGVHVELAAFVEERGYYWEQLDGETFFLYES